MKKKRCLKDVIGKVKLKILGVSRYYFKGDTPIMLGPSLEVAY